MKKVPELFGSMVFNEAVMKERLPKDVYKALKQTVRQGTALDPQVAGVVANAMKDWAIEKGATHFTHWFQPMTGITAEKHDSFISPYRRWHGDHGILRQGADQGRAGRVLPSRPAVCAQPLRRAAIPRGTRPAYAFIKDDTLCIPTAFCSYTRRGAGQKDAAVALDGGASTRQALRILRLFGNDDVTA